MKAQIYKLENPESGSRMGISFLSRSYNLPLLSTDLRNAYNTEFSEYVLFLGRDISDAGLFSLTNSIIYNITEEQLKTINEHWNNCILNNTDIDWFTI